jgi:PhnB protein
MNRIETYIHFNGNCEEALNFYKESLGGEIIIVSRFGDAPGSASEEQKKKIMHATFRIGDSGFMASDTMIERPVTPGSNFAMSIGSDDEAATRRMFDKLSQGGQVTMPLEVQFWGDLFGMLKDKFGIAWMFNCSMKK